MNSDYQLILGSKSPRRQALLKELGIQFEVLTKSVEEDYPSGLEVIEVAEFLANKKADAYDLDADQMVITADTVVIHQGKILGKPADETDAINTLSQLSGETHSVVTGVCLKTRDKQISFKEITEVTFASLTPGEIEHYVQKFQPLDKAGSYGIQEWIGMIGISSIQGDYYNVVGLPLHAIWKSLKTFE